MILAKPRRYESAAYLDWIRGLMCLACGRQPVHAHHVRFEGEGGIGTKVSDTHATPLCFECHRDYHDYGRERFERKHGLDMNREVRRLNAAYIERMESKNENSN